MLNLKKYRELKGVSQTSAAKELGISRQTYNNYELGKRQADYEMLMIDVGRTSVVRENAAKTVNGIRSITVAPFVADLIQARSGDYVTSMSGQAIYKHFSRVMAKAGYSITFHDLRHINASVMLYLGVPDKYAMERGGWARCRTSRCALLRNSFPRSEKEGR